MSESCRHLNPSVLALLPVHLGTLVTGNLRGFASSVLRRPHQNHNGEFRLKLAGVGNPLVQSSTDTLTEG